MDETTDIEFTHSMSADGLTLTSRGETESRDAIISLRWRTLREVEENLERTKVANEKRIREKLSQSELKSGFASLKSFPLGPLSLELFRARERYSEGTVLLGPLKLTRRGLRRATAPDRGIRVGFNTRNHALGLRLTKRRPVAPQAGAGEAEPREFAVSEEIPRRPLPIESYDELLPVFENPLSVGDPLTIPAGIVIFDGEGASTEAARKRHVKVSRRTDGHYALEDPTEELREAGYLGSVVAIPPRAYWGNAGQHIELTPEILEANMLPEARPLEGAHLPLAVAIESGLYDLSALLKPQAEQED